MAVVKQDMKNIRRRKMYAMNKILKILENEDIVFLYWYSNGLNLNGFPHCKWQREGKSFAQITEEDREKLLSAHDDIFDLNEAWKYAFGFTYSWLFVDESHYEFKQMKAIKEIIAQRMVHLDCQYVL